MNNQTQVKFWYRKELCDKLDWRIAFIWNLEEELNKVPWNNNTHNWEIGSIFTLTQAFIFNKDKIDIVIPEMTALYLNISNKNYLSSKQCLSNLNKDKSTWYIHLEEDAFNFLEDITVSIVFAISALEVFFNQLLLNKDKDIVFLVEKKKIEKKEI